MTSALLLTALPSNCRGPRQPILGLSPKRLLLGPSCPSPCLGLPQGLRLGCLLRDRPRGEQGGGLLRSWCPFSVALGPRCPPGRAWMNGRSAGNLPARVALPVLGQACQPVWLVLRHDGSIAHSTLRLAADRVLSDSLPIATCSRCTPLGLERDPGFLPASRIDGQSLPWGRRCSLVIAAAGNSARHRTSSCLGRLEPP
jgi:hypothetical protein